MGKTNPRSRNSCNFCLTVPTSRPVLFASSAGSAGSINSRFASDDEMSLLSILGSIFEFG